jgi:hypothetical protein
MNIQELIGTRCLMKLTGSYPHRDSIDEFKIIEISPSGNWVKLRNRHGLTFWKPIVEISLVEKLIDLKSEPCPKS